MLSDINVPPTDEYRTGTENEPLTFYLEALTESRRADVLLGYFSSSAISVLALGMAKFISGGGRMRLIINDVLSTPDKAALLRGTSTRPENYGYLASDFQTLRQALDSYGIHFFNCIAWLIASGRIQIRAIKPKGRRGIAHYKSGIFYDGRDKVKFTGSCNFTASGLLENLEELQIRASWNANGAVFTTYEEEYERLFAGTADHAELIPFEQIEAVIAREYGGKDVDELLIDEQKLVAQKAKEVRSENHQKAVAKILQKIETYFAAPRFPYETGPRPYQQGACENWARANCQGIFAMATGTGKTITSLNCVLNEYQKTGHYQAVILVPTTVLVEQWTQEARKFNFREIIPVSSKSVKWPAELGRITAQLSFGVATSFVVIVTYKSFTKPAFQSYFKRLPTTTILLADEAHNIASPSVAKLLDTIHLTKRIGLSATPKRVYDPEGSEKMEAFFGDKEPYTYNFPMERAIDEGILCPYYYYPKIVSLTPDEMVKYAEISAKLAKLYARANGDKAATAELTARTRDLQEQEQLSGLTNARYIVNSMNSAIADITRYSEQLTKLHGQKEQKEKQQRDINDKLSELSEGEVPVHLIQKKSILFDLAELAKRVKKTKYQELVQQLENTANEHYRNINAPTGAFFGTIRFVETGTPDRTDGGYRPAIVDNDGREVGNLNTSLVSSLKLSIIMAIVSANKTRNYASFYPLISDAPVSDFDVVKAMTFFREAANTFRQSIVIVKELLIEDDNRPGRYKPDLDRLRELNAAVGEAGQSLNVYQLDMPDGVSNTYRSELEIKIQRVTC